MPCHVCEVQTKPTSALENLTHMIKVKELSVGHQTRVNSEIKIQFERGIVRYTYDLGEEQ